MGGVGLIKVSASKQTAPAIFADLEVKFSAGSEKVLSDE